MFFSSVHTSYFPAREASALKIPGFGIVDTNTWSQAVSLPIPGNDESVFCAIFYNDLIANYILVRKFSLVLMWFLNVRSAPRVISFSKWLRSHYSLTTKNFNLYKDFAQILNSNNNNLYKGISLFFSRNVAVNKVFENLDIFNNSYNISDFSSVLNSLLKRRLVLAKALNVNFIKKMIFRKKTVFRKKFLTGLRFKTKFLKKKFRASKYLRGNYTLGKFRSFKIELKNKVLQKKRFFLNVLSDFFFFNKYKNYIAKRFLRRSILTNNLKFNYVTKLVRAVVSKYGIKINNSSQKKKNYTIKYIKYRNLFIAYLNKQPPLLKKLDLLQRLKRNSKFHFVLKKLSYLNSYVKNKNIYLIKTLITSNNKLKFLYNNIFFDRYIKSSLLWNLKTLVPKSNLLPNNLLTFYYFGFFKRTTLNNVPILFEGFSNKNFRKYLGIVRYKGLGVWMWH